MLSTAMKSGLEAGRRKVSRMGRVLPMRLEMWRMSGEYRLSGKQR